LLAGVILFGRNVGTLEEVHALTGRVHAEAAPGFPPFVAVDQEGGPVRRLRERVLEVPAMRRLGKRDDVELTSRVAAAMATELVALGFNLNFAPVADVDSNPKNPVIGERAFGSDPSLVTRHVKAWVAAFQAAGLMACVKHFPGHGDTQLDSHLELPEVARSSVSLRQLELYPFERVVRGSAAVMTAHVVFQALDSLPATLSPRISTTLLRKEFGFEGVLFSDDLEMGALSKHWPIEESAVRAVEAGCDALLICADETLQQRAHAALSSRAASDSEFRQRCVQAVERSLTQRRKFPEQRAAKFRQCEKLFEQHATLQAELRKLRG
jgi:beta-N-acetylhexosaminidase